MLKILNETHHGVLGGPGDYFPPCSGHPHDPRTDDEFDDESEAFEDEEDAALDRMEDR